MIRICRRRQREKGFVLILVLAMIAIASIMMATLTTRSVRLATEAMSVERAMQVRWAKASLTRVVGNSSQLVRTRRNSLDASSIQTTRQPVRTVYTPIRLSGRVWNVVIDDESAKLPITKAAERFDDPIYQQLVAATMRTRGANGTTLLQPSRTTKKRRSAGRHSGHRSYRWEHWLQAQATERSQTPNRLESAAGVGGSVADLIASTSGLTLWGDGRMNVYSVSDDVLSLMWRQLYGDRVPQSLERLRRDDSWQNLEQLRPSLDLRESQWALFRQWFKTESDCHGVWVWCDSDPRIDATQFIRWKSGDRWDQRSYDY